MRGSVFKRKGRKTWSVIVNLGRDPKTGRRKQEWHNGAAPSERPSAP
jgi:hypothetical protein